MLTRFVDSMSNVVGYRQTELCCQLGLMLTSEQALKVGLIDEIVSPESIQDKAQNEMKRWLKIPGKYLVLYSHAVQESIFVDASAVISIAFLAC